MGSAGSVHGDGFEDSPFYHAGHHLLRFKVLVWNAKPEHGLDERWGLVIKKSSISKILAYYEFNVAEEKLGERYNPMYKWNPDQIFAAGTMLTNTCELETLSVKALKAICRNEDYESLAHDAGRLFVVNILNRFSLGDIEPLFDSQSRNMFSPTKHIKLGSVKHQSFSALKKEPSTEKMS
jgi:hypothetical protein